MAEPLEISYQMPGVIAGAIRALGPSARQALNAEAGSQLSDDIRAHLGREAALRHSWAHRLGASPTGHLGKAETSFRADAGAATVTVHSPGISRAFHDLRIVTRNKPYLTIPVHRLGYGRRASEVSAAHRLFRPKGRDFLMAKVDGKATVIYLLRKAVLVPQDRTLLPSDDELAASAKKGFSKGFHDAWDAYVGENA